VPPRILLWGHSHGGNVLALLTNLLGADPPTRREFFHATRSFYHRWRSSRVDFPVWQRVEDLLLDAGHPLRRVALDVVTFGTPIRYGWDAGGYANLLHFNEHRSTRPGRDWLAPYPPRPLHVVSARAGDFVQQIGIAGSGFLPNPLAWRTCSANRRLRRLVARHVPRWLITNLRAAARVADEGTTLLVDYRDPARFPSHLFGHAMYTRQRWLPLHCGHIATEFYGASSPA
jgi:hypothetical protein